MLKTREVEQALGPFDEIVLIRQASGSGRCWRVRTGVETSVVKVIVHEHEPGRFEREVEALSRLESPRVVRVIDSGRLETKLGVFPYLRSEFVPGGNLREHLGNGVSPTDSHVRTFLLELLEGLAELASERVVHRDLKPENIILRDGDWATPVIIDLGLSRLLDRSSLTIYPWAGGTWPYMAPEQMRAERATERSDVWAAAIVASEVANGSHPFWRGEPAVPRDWDARLRTGPSIPGSRPAALRDWVAMGAEYRAYRRPDARQSVAFLEEEW